ncbi:MAG: hypothetical protein GC154_14715 [bacterium]|nr:hypothetical protein [bacterium]
MRLSIGMTIIFACCAAAVSQPVYQKGYSYTPWSRNALMSASSSESIQNMKNAGVEYVALCVWWFQDGQNSSVITPDYNRFSASEESIVKGIQDIHAAGLKVLLKPMVDLRTGDWRGTLNASAAWFDEYERFITHWAALAEEQNAELFSIGCEFANISGGTKWETEWRRVIASVRAAYSGPLTYAAQHGKETSIRWWDALDYIGIDAYYPLTGEDDPTLDELRAAWEAKADAIEFWLKRTWPDKPVIFTEIGYRSFNGANQRPWEYASDDPSQADMQEQIDCYTAALETLTRRDWFWGFYWWNWETNPNAGGTASTSYTVQNKPAEALLRDWYVNQLTGGRFETPSAARWAERYR